MLYRRGDMTAALSVADRAVATLRWEVGEDDGVMGGDADRAEAARWADERVDHTVDLARALNNRAVVCLYLGELDRAEADFDRAEAIYRRAAMHGAAAVASHNRGMVYARRGDLPRALAAFEDAERDLVAVGAPVDRQVVAWAEVLVVAGLAEDVIELLPDVIGRLAEHGLPGDAAEAGLYLAEASVALGRHDAVTLAEQSAERFGALGRRGWAAVADALAVRARLVQHGPASVSIERARTVAEVLDERGMATFAGGSWLVCAEVARARGDARAERAALRRVLPRGSTLPEQVLFVGSCGPPGPARRTPAGRRHRGAARPGPDRAPPRLFAATELRALASEWGAGLATIGLELAVDDGPEAVFAAAERWRATALDPGRRRPPVDHGLVAALGRYRAAHAALGLGCARCR